jgi:hypothetical protein
LNSRPSVYKTEIDRRHEHPKLAVTAIIDSEGFGAKLEAARERTAKIIEFRKSGEEMLASSTEK